MFSKLNKSSQLNFDLMDPSLPAWNYSISGLTGSGMKINLEQEAQIKIEIENQLFDHFIETGEVVDSLPNLKVTF